MRNFWHGEMYVNLPSYIQDRGISAGSDWVASRLWVVLKEKSMEIIKIASTSGLPRFVFSLEPLEVIAFYNAFSPPCKYSPLPGES